MKIAVLGRHRRSVSIAAVLLSAAAFGAFMSHTRNDEPLDPFEATDRGRAESNRHTIRVDDKVGLIDDTGEVVAPPDFDEIGEFSEGLAPVRTQDRYGYINSGGLTVINPQFDAVGAFFDGLAPIRLGERWGYINRGGNITINPQFDRASEFRDGIALVALSGKFGFIDDEGQYVVNPQFDEAKLFTGKLAAVRVGELWGFVDRSGRYRINLQFQDVGNFSLGRAAVKSGGRWGYVNEQGKIVVNPQFENAGTFREGLARVESGGRWGYINKHGTIVINPQFDNATSFEEGVARVQSGGRWGLIDKRGRFVVNPQFDEYRRYSAVGVAAVKSGARWYFITRDGQRVGTRDYPDVAPFKGELAFVALNRFTAAYVGKDGNVVWQGEPPTRIAEAAALVAQLLNPAWLSAEDDLIGHTLDIVAAFDAASERPAVYFRETLDSLHKRGFDKLATLRMLITDLQQRTFSTDGTSDLQGKSGALLEDVDRRFARLFSWLPECAAAANHKARIECLTNEDYFGGVEEIIFTARGNELRDPLGLTYVLQSASSTLLGIIGLSLQDVHELTGLDRQFVPMGRNRLIQRDGSVRAVGYGLGRVMYDAECAMCHYPSGTADMHGFPKAPDLRETLKHGDRLVDLEAIAGGRTIPGHPLRRLHDMEAAAVAVYVDSLRRTR